MVFACHPERNICEGTLVAAKAMGLNTIRVIWGGLRVRDLDVFDELGMLVQQEHYGGIQIAPSPGPDASLRCFPVRRHPPRSQSSQHCDLVPAQ